MAKTRDEFKTASGKLRVERLFTTAAVDPFDEVEWERRDAVIGSGEKVAFEQKRVEFPKAWSQNATNIVAQKYFRGPLGTPRREWSVKQMIGRVVGWYTERGIDDGYLPDPEDIEAFRSELTHLLLMQRMAFNSPVWFNVGLVETPRVSACFVLDVEDDMRSILNWYVEEGLIFKAGSGAGINLSKLRSSKEQLSSGGLASGPVSFMRGADASAGTIKSGGSTRRAAKMVVLDVDHPDIEEFIWCKVREEQKARALREAGFDMDLDGADSHSLQYQNANNSVGLTEEFIQAYLADKDWHLKAVKDGRVLKTVKARDLMGQIAKAAWQCADPGVFYLGTLNKWHTSPAAGPIRSTNPCAEFCRPANTSCNLASLRVTKFVDDGGEFEVDAFVHAVETTLTAMDISVTNAEYPTEKITNMAATYRELGLGYTDLGALLMGEGIAYDSDEGRAWAAAITALMGGVAYRRSAEIAAALGPYPGWHKPGNAEAHLSVVRMHRAAVDQIDASLAPAHVLEAARRAWEEALELGERYGYRNAQTTLIAPTGTISFLMDADTTGVEPDLALVKIKKLVGGGTMKIVNQAVPGALKRLGYQPEQISEIVSYIGEHNTVKGAPFMKREHYPVFDCAMGESPIHYMGHVKMMAAVQPFLSGAISKCVVGSTLLPTGDGLVRIESLYDGEKPDTFRPHFMEIASLGGPQKTDAFYYGGKRPVREITTRSGHKVIATPNHRLLAAGKGRLVWKRLDEIQEGDYVAIQYGLDLWSATPPFFSDFVPTKPYGNQKKVGIPSEMTDDLALLLGAYASEGHTARSNWTIRITNSVPEILERLAAAVRSTFGVEPVIESPRNRCQNLVIASKEIVEFFEYLGCGSRASSKRIPNAILRSPRSMVLTFLRGLFLDGYCTRFGNGLKLAICMDSPALLDDLQAVLTNLGIVHGRITKANKRIGKTYDEVYATGSSAKKLIELVPFLEPDKAERARPLAALENPRHDTADVVAGISGRELYELIPKSISGRRGQSHRKGFTFLLDPRTKNVTRRTIERVAGISGVKLPDWLQTVLDDNLHFSPVAIARDGGAAEVFDVSVRGTQAFVGNGIVNHNTVNMLEDVSVEDIEALYLEGWRLGLKNLAIYRDNCKVAQPLSADKKAADAPAATEHPKPVRRRLPRKRSAKTMSFRIAECDGYVTAGEYPDTAELGEIFLKVAKQGSTLAGIMDAFAISVSLGLQYGVPLKAYVEKFINMRFEPSGITDDPDFRFASSIVDYIFRRLAADYLTESEREAINIKTTEERQAALDGGVPVRPNGRESEPVESAEAAGQDAPLCYTCGIRMQPAGSCFVCGSCGTTSGCS